MGAASATGSKGLEVRQVVTSVMSAYGTALIRVVCPLTILFWPPRWRRMYTQSLCGGSACADRGVGVTCILQREGPAACSHVDGHGSCFLGRRP